MCKSVKMSLKKKQIFSFRGMGEMSLARRPCRHVSNRLGAKNYDVVFIHIYCDI